MQGIEKHALGLMNGEVCGTLYLMSFGDGIPLIGIINDTSTTLLMIVWLLISFAPLLIPSNFTIGL